MNPEYALYCDADPYFYDAPRRVPSADGARGALFAAARRPAPEGWERVRRGDWVACTPRGARLPAQGWKIHVSAATDNAAAVLERVADYCLGHGVPFKFVPSPYLLLTRNTKYADRAGSGKFVTVYPADDAACGTVAADLDRLLAGEHGPYVLSDLRWGDGPVYVRYGAFAQRFCHAADGALVPAVESAEGTLVPDLRGPSFRVPDWVEPPAFLAPHLAARAGQSTEDLPYTVERALHFSNGGGVYEGRDKRTGERVVLKEARPYAGLAADGADAVARLAREQHALERLSGLACVPRFRDSFTVGDHRFLVMEHIEGTTLNTVFARRFPLSAHEPDAALLAEHAAWALRTHDLVARAVAQVHARGMVFSDLHMSNVMVAPDGESVTLLDFEAATTAASESRQVVANPAFVAPADRRGTAIDRYALACLRLALFVPLTTLLPLDREKARHLADLAAERYPVDRALFDAAVAEIGRGAGPAGEASTVGSPVPAPRRVTARAASGAAPGEAAGRDGGYLPTRPGDWPAARDSMVRALHASATPDRDDRFFPGDIAQFASPCGGQSFGYGAAGVLYALAGAGSRRQDAEEWLLTRSAAPASGTPSGFYDGLAGIAWTLDRLGHRDDALRLAHLVAEQPLEGLGTGLHSGLAGVGLALDDLAASTGDTSLHRTALRCAELAARPLAAAAGRRERAGLLHGASGTALLFVRLYERLGDPGLLDVAAVALRRDLARCVTDPRGALLVDEGRRTMPYLGGGSTGIGAVLDDYLAHRADDAFEEARSAILGAALSSFYIQPGLFRGVAGLVLHLARTTALRDERVRRDALRRQVALLGWHAVPWRGELAFPGEQLSRLSMDLSTGTAGCLLALGGLAERTDPTAAPTAPTTAPPDTATDGVPRHLPFLPPPKRPPEPVPSQGPRTSTTAPVTS
ncbi:class III lanthionine synthetase LanKC [Streptomyces sp. NPDC060194]|uniref:class III lanthionine synthetase LanKC n=1 Tax=Streptomyces sp. NPDC060194 TaxID=3347069 RepID=UPI0036524EE0